MYLNIGLRVAPPFLSWCNHKWPNGVRSCMLMIWMSGCQLITIAWGFPPPTTSEIIICSFLWRAPYKYKPSLSTISGPGIPRNYSKGPWDSPEYQSLLVSFAQGRHAASHLTLQDAANIAVRNTCGVTSPMPWECLVTGLRSRWVFWLAKKTTWKQTKSLFLILDVSVWAILIHIERRKKQQWYIVCFKRRPMLSLSNINMYQLRFFSTCLELLYKFKVPFFGGISIGRIHTLQKSRQIRRSLPRDGTGHVTACDTIGTFGG